MIPSVHPKTALSPLVAVAFAVIGATGILLFFDVHSGPVMVLHEWFGWVFVLGGAAHLVLNRGPLLAHLRQRAGLVSLGCALLLAVAMFVAGLNAPAHGPRGPHGERGPAAAYDTD